MNFPNAHYMILHDWYWKKLNLSLLAPLGTLSYRFIISLFDIYALLPNNSGHKAESYPSLSCFKWWAYTGKIFLCSTWMLMMHVKESPFIDSFCQYFQAKFWSLATVELLWTTLYKFTLFRSRAVDPNKSAIYYPPLPTTQVSNPLSLLAEKPLAIITIYYDCLVTIAFVVALHEWHEQLPMYSWRY